jgi:hypothetical protein
MDPSHVHKQVPQHSPYFVVGGKKMGKKKTMVIFDMKGFLKSWLWGEA